MNGKFRWQRDLGPLIRRFVWGGAGAPVAHGDSLVVNWDQEQEAALICLDASTGKTKWKVERDEKSTWTTPLVVEHKGTTQVIVNGTKRVSSYDLANGKLLWDCGG